MQAIWTLYLNPFLWEGVVFALFGLVCAAGLSAIWGFPRRLIDLI